MRIVHLLQSDRFSGAESVVCQIINMFQDETELEMIYVSPDGPIREALKSRNIEYYPLQKFSQNNINRALRILKPNIIHAHDFNASVRASAYRHARIISHIHNNPRWLPKICVNSVVYAIASSKYERIIGVSEPILNEYFFKNAIRNKFVCLPNIVDAEIVINKAKAEKVEPIDILYVGRLSEPKNPIGFLRIVKTISERSSIRPLVTMLGVGPLQEECEKYIKGNSLSNNVKMCGFDTNPYKYMNATKLLIMPSIYEGFGLVAVEAMILGKVVLASPVGGLNIILKDGGGILCENEDSFAENAINLLCNDNNRMEIGKKAQIMARRFSDKDNYKKLLRDIYLVQEL